MSTRHQNKGWGAAKLLLVAGSVAALGCETEKLHGEPVSADEADLRDEAALHPVDRRDDHAETAEELKRRQHLEGDGKKPESAAELRKEMKLHEEGEGE